MKKKDEYEGYEKDREACAILRAASGCGPKAHQFDKEQKPIAYLKGRGLNTVPDAAMLLPRSHRFTGFHFPAMVLPIMHAAGAPGAHVTLLDRDARENLRGQDGKNIRRIYGHAKGGYVVVKPAEQDKPLIIAEGFETALAASELTGYPAIAALSADNLANVEPPRCAELIYAADNDDAGRAGAKEAAARLRHIGIVRIARPPEQYNDWNDAVRDPDANPDLLRRLILHAATPTPAELDLVRVQSLGMRDFLAISFPRRQYLLKPWLTTTGLVMIDALPGHGKTWLGLSSAYAVASGQPLLGWTVEKAARVLYVDGELPGELLQQRIAKLGPELPGGHFRVLSHSQFEAGNAMMFDLGTEEGRNALDEEIERHDIGLIILNSLSTLVRSGEDNDVASWRQIQAWSLKHRARGRAVIFLHHHGRSGKPRGTSSREIVLDTRLKLTRDHNLSTDKETAFKLEFEKAREFYGADAEPLMAYLSMSDGVASWRRESVKANTRERYKELASQGYKDTQIAKELNLTRGRISQIRKEIQAEAANEKDV